MLMNWLEKVNNLPDLKSLELKLQDKKIEESVLPEKLGMKARRSRFRATKL